MIRVCDLWLPFNFILKLSSGFWSKITLKKTNQTRFFWSHTLVGLVLPAHSVQLLQSLFMGCLEFEELAGMLSALFLATLHLGQQLFAFLLPISKLLFQDPLLLIQSLTAAAGLGQRTYIQKKEHDASPALSQHSSASTFSRSMQSSSTSPCNLCFVFSSDEHLAWVASTASSASWSLVASFFLQDTHW